MKGAILGDIVGSRFEFKNHLSKDFQMFTYQSVFTDDTVCTIATMDWLMNQSQDYSFYLKKWCRRYPNAGYSGMFKKWIDTSDKPYNSFGNGAGMRVSPVGLFGSFIGEVLMLAEKTAIATHNHPEGIKGAKAIALAVYLAKSKSKQEIKTEIEKLGYKIELPEKKGVFDATSQVTVPHAIACFLESNSFEDAIRIAVSIGGDSDTITSMTGGIAEAFYGIDEKYLKYLPDEFTEIIDKFYKFCDKRQKDASSETARMRFVFR